VREPPPIYGLRTDPQIEILVNTFFAFTFYTALCAFESSNIARQFIGLPRGRILYFLTGNFLVGSVGGKRKILRLW
jgi:hypothetical protein